MPYSDGAVSPIRSGPKVPKKKKKKEKGDKAPCDAHFWAKPMQN